MFYAIMEKILSLGMTVSLGEELHAQTRALYVYILRSLVRPPATGRWIRCACGRGSNAGNDADPAPARVPAAKYAGSYASAGAYASAPNAAGRADAIFGNSVCGTDHAYARDYAHAHLITYAQSFPHAVALCGMDRFA